MSPVRMGKEMKLQTEDYQFVQQDLRIADIFQVKLNQGGIKPWQRTPFVKNLSQY